MKTSPKEWREAIVPKFHPDHKPTVDVRDGWRSIIEDLVAALDRTRIPYKITQCIARSGVLWFYVDYPVDLPSDKVNLIISLIHEAERRGYKTCEDCGREGHCVSLQYRPYVLCPSCKKARQEPKEPDAQ